MLDLFALLAQAPAGPEGDGGIFLVGGGCMLAWILISLVGLVLWIWALVDAIQNPSLSGNEKLIWVLVIILTSLLGAVLYLLIGRKRGAAA
jgi:hypothetical protein